MAVGKTEICNMALTPLGERRIHDIDSDTDETAVLCRLYYDNIVDEVLRSHPWNCAVWYQSLAQLSSTDDDYLIDGYDNYDYQYILPTNPYCLRVLSIPEHPDENYQIVGRYLLSNLETVVLEYIKRITNPTQFDPLLVSAIAYRLSADLAMRITNSEKTRNDMIRIYEWQLNRAGAIDGIESEAPQVEEYAVRDAKDE
jgi:hypothetical protein